MLSPLITLLTVLAYAVKIASLVIAVALLARMALHWAQVNPFGWFPMKLRTLTEPIIRPLRPGFDNRLLRFDMVPIVAALLVVLNGFFLSMVLDGYASAFAVLAVSGTTVRGVLTFIVLVLVNTLLAMFVLRFLMQQFRFGYSSPFYRLVYSATEPILKPFRRWFYFGGPLDFSAMIAIVAVQLAGWFLIFLLGVGA